MNKDVEVRYNIGDEEIKLTPAIVKNYLASGKDITMPEFKMFSSLCKVHGLNPFLREAYIIKYGNNPAQIVVGKDAILKRATLHPQFDGREQGIIALDQNGIVKEKKGTFILSSETLVGAWAKVYRKDWKYPVYITVSFSEVAQKKSDGSLNHNWSTKGATMVEKVALVRALREAFSEDVAGMYDEGEVAGNIIIEQDNTESEQNDTFEDIEEAQITEDVSVVDINKL